MAMGDFDSLGELFFVLAQLCALNAVILVVVSIAHAAEAAEGGDMKTESKFTKFLKFFKDKVLLFWYALVTVITVVIFLLMMEGRFGFFLSIVGSLKFGVGSSKLRGLGLPPEKIVVMGKSS